MVKKAWRNYGMDGVMATQLSMMCVVIVYLKSNVQLSFYMG